MAKKNDKRMVKVDNEVFYIKNIIDTLYEVFDCNGKYIETIEGYRNTLDWIGRNYKRYGKDRINIPMNI